jgi:hypothetical protein
MSALSKAATRRRTPNLKLPESFNPANNFKHEVAARANALAF